MPKRSEKSEYYYAWQKWNFSNFVKFTRSKYRHDGESRPHLIFHFLHYWIPCWTLYLEPFRQFRHAKNVIFDFIFHWESGFWGGKKVSDMLAGSERGGSLKKNGRGHCRKNFAETIFRPKNVENAEIL